MPHPVLHDCCLERVELRGGSRNNCASECALVGACHNTDSQETSTQQQAPRVVVMNGTHRRRPRGLGFRFRQMFQKILLVGSVKNVAADYLAGCLPVHGTTNLQATMTQCGDSQW